jgi:hypothetical protein
VQDTDKVSPATAQGVAIREFVEPSGAKSLYCLARIQTLRDVVSVEPPGTQISATTHGC